MSIHEAPTVLFLSAFIAAGSCTTGGLTAADPPKTPFERVEIDAQPPDRPWIKAIGYLEGDGRLDVIVGGSRGPLVWYANPTWTKRVIADGGYDSVDAATADLDGDGDLDVVVGGVLWYENSGDVLKDSWKEHIFSAAWQHGDCKVEVGDFNGDGHLDIVLSPAELKGGTYHIAWCAVPADPASSHWQEHVIEKSVETGVHGLAVADMNRDGRPDVICASMHQGKSPREVNVYFNGDGGRNWTKLVVSTKGSHNIVVADLDDDSRPDILGANHGGPFQPVELWKNRLRAQP